MQTWQRSTCITVSQSTEIRGSFSGRMHGFGDIGFDEEVKTEMLGKEKHKVVPLC